jgi:hypothetical protein
MRTALKGGKEENVKQFNTREGNVRTVGILNAKKL